ncbi:hypothetical protein [Candidatus Merdisoma sp. JLR.KK006]|uniref:hypothetical protein n=1 Tax=Candidatus Merdisoma sp. JLR.KK006 TaxID=3112626 RepID=UPI002FF0AE18
MMSNVNEKNWNEFRRTGLLWLVNSILHLFGWAIVYEIEDGVVQRVYPARVTCRGFDEKSNTEGYIKVSEYLQENINSLLNEAKN